METEVYNGSFVNGILEGRGTITITYRSELVKTEVYDGTFGNGVFVGDVTKTYRRGSITNVYNGRMVDFTTN
jgi:hypothetical protein